MGTGRHAIPCRPLLTHSPRKGLASNVRRRHLYDKRHNTAGSRLLKVPHPTYTMRARTRSVSLFDTINAPRWQTLWYAPCQSRYVSATGPRQTRATFNRSDFGGQPFTGIYEPDQPTQGPLGGTSDAGIPRVTPRVLKEHLDEFVVGQERAKRVISTAVYNHYQRIEELKRQNDEYEKLVEKRARMEMVTRHPVEDEYPGQHLTVRRYPPQRRLEMYTQDDTTIKNIEDLSLSLTLEKSNLLILGPSGVGKTLMAKTLARVLDVPFSMSDCTPLTQAGYIGEDVDIVIQRLLAAANYDIAKAESGIVVLDEIDKIATARVSHGKDVSGEGVQQALLKIIEGTTVTVQAKNEKMSAATGRERDRSSGSQAGHQPASSQASTQGPPGGKNEVYSVRTDNILFICTGAFIGLHKNIMDRLAKGSIGFNAHVSAANPSASRGAHDTTIRIDSSNSHLFKEHLPLPMQTPASGILTTPYSHSEVAPLPRSLPSDTQEEEENLLNTLDLVTPADLQKFGLIPELVGRIPVHCAVTPLSENALVRVLTEPRNALLKQYLELFALSNIELKFTQAALRAVAHRASGMSTGARALRGVMETVLSTSMYECPGSSAKYVLITKDVVERKAAPIHLARGQSQLFQSLIQQEEDKESDKSGQLSGEDSYATFEEYRKQAVSASG